MTPQEAAEILKRHNEWRRWDGDPGDINNPEPKQVGQAIDVLAAYVSEINQSSITKEEAKTYQDWASLDGAVAWHLIERHADSWGDVSMMMDAWLDAKIAARAK